MAFADRFRRRQGLGAVTGFNGGSLQDQLDEDPQQPTGQMLTAANQAAITRPRQVSPFTDRFNQLPAQPNEFAGPSVPQPQPTAPMPSQSMPQPDDVTMVNPDATRPRVATNPFLARLMNDPSRQERPREVTPTDDVTKSSDYMRQISDKPLSLRDKAGLVAQNIAVNLGGTPLATRRQRDIGRAQEGLQRDLAVQKARDTADLNQLVPFTLPDGSTTLVPARTAGSLGSRQQGQVRTATDRETRTTGYLDHLKTLKGDAQKKLTAQLYKLGAFNGSPEGLKYAAEVLGVPNEMKDAFIAGQMRDAVDDNGNLTEVNRQTGAATGVADKAGAPVRSWTAEQFKVAEQGRNQRARDRNAQSEKNATIVSGGRVAAMGDPSVHRNNIADIDKDIAEIDDQIKTMTAKQQTEGLTANEGATLKGLPREKQQLQRERRDWQEKLGKIESAQGNQATRGTGQTAPMGKGSFNLGAWKAAHPNATPEQIQSQRAKAKARQLAIVE